jgi:Kef-type K+ transport system membrane component KefB
VLDDIVLWVVIAMLTAVASDRTLATSEVTFHLSVTVMFLAVGLLWLPRALKHIHVAQWNLLGRSAPTSYVVMMLLSYTALAVYLDVTLALAGFLAGFGVVGGATGQTRAHFAPYVVGIERVAFAFPIPIYFVAVGTQIELSDMAHIRIMLLFLVGSSLLRGGAMMLASRVAGFGWLSSTNIAVSANARGGPGIVLATIVYDAGVISASLFGALILTAIFTSQLAGVWLGYVQRSGRPLLDPKSPTG